MDESCGPDCRVYMLVLSDDYSGFRLVNFLGYKAGSFLAGRIPREAAAQGAMNVRLSWLRENWDACLSIGTFESTRFFAWSSEATA